jgi:hypothetical protein
MSSRDDVIRDLIIAKAAPLDSFLLIGIIYAVVHGKTD